MRPFNWECNVLSNAAQVVRWKRIVLKQNSSGFLNVFDLVITFAPVNMRLDSESLTLHNHSITFLLRFALSSCNLFRPRGVDMSQSSPQPVSYAMPLPWQQSAW